MSNQKLLQRIKKLLALSKSSNAHEAALALQRAQKLMQEHNITAVDAELLVISEEETRGAPSNAEKTPRYMIMLTNLISRALGVRAIYSWRLNSSLRHVRVLRFYGVNERPAVAAYAFEVLARQMLRGKKEYMSQQRKSIKRTTKIARGDAYCESWVRGAAGSVSAFVLTENEEQLLATYIERLESTGKVKGQVKVREAKRAVGTDEAAWAGYLDGKKAQLHRGVDGSTAPAPLQIGGA